jgi:hypothetical protein
MIRFILSNFLRVCSKKNHTLHREYSSKKFNQPMERIQNNCRCGATHRFIPSELFPEA